MWRPTKSGMVKSGKLVGSAATTRWWSVFFFCFGATFTIWDYLNGEYWASTVMAFITGTQLVYATAVHDWRKIAKDWRELYEMVRDRRGLTNGR